MKGEIKMVTSDVEKKYYTWDEIRKMPFGTKFKLPQWGTLEFICFERDKISDQIYIVDETGGCNDYKIYIMLQDRFEIVEEKKDKVFPSEKSGNASLSVECSSCKNMVKINKILKFYNLFLCEKCFDATPVLKEIAEIFKKEEPSKEKGYFAHDVPCDCGREDCVTNKDKEKQYVTLGQAIDNIWSGEWFQIGFDEIEWLENYKFICSGIHNLFTGNYSSNGDENNEHKITICAISQEYAKQKKWFKVK